MTGSGNVNAALVDCWGRPHRLFERCEIGRDPIASGLVIGQPSVSRRHARIDYRDAGTAVLVDLGSANSTIVGNHEVCDSVELLTGDLIFFGAVGFYYVSPMPHFDRVFKVHVATERLQSTETTAVTSVGGFEALEGEDLERIDFRLAEATGGGGGVVRVSGNELRVSMVQFQFLDLLMRRMRSDLGQPAAVRGYVHSSEILGAISWDTAHPSDNNVKQLVRRVRRVLEIANIENPIEAKQGLGYRLGFRPEQH